MDKKENGALAPTSSNAPNNNLTVNSLAQSTQQGQAFVPDGGLRSKKTDDWLKKRKPLAITAKVNTLAVKCYEEQMPYGWDYVCSVIRATSPDDFQVIAICHCRCTYADEGHFWKPAIEKWHYHIIMRCTDSKKRIRVKQLLECLGIKYRPGLDDELWAKGHRGQAFLNLCPI